MALTVPIPLVLGRFKQLPQRSNEVWQGGLVRLPTWIADPADPDGPPYRPTGAVWVSLRTGLVHLALPPDGATASPEFAFAALLEFGLKHAKRLDGRPSRVEVRDPKLCDVIAAALTALSTAVVTVDELPAVREVLMQFEADTSGGQRLPGLLDSPAITPDRLRAFAGAAASFYAARVWDHLANADLIEVEVEGRGVPKGMRHVSVLGQGGAQFGLAFFDSRAAFERVLGATDARRAANRAYGVTFGPIDELPFSDVDAWLDHGLPLAGPRAYPLPADMHRDGTMRRPDARELTHTEALLRALAVTVEDEMDSGRWHKHVDTYDGAVDVTMTLPLLLEAESGRRPTAVRLSAMPRAAERSSVRIARLLEHRSFESLDDLNAELAKAEHGGLFDATADANRELTALERAQELAYDAMEADGRLQVKRARQALAISPDCADAWVILAEAASTPDVAIERYVQGMEAGARAIGPGRFESLSGEFWSHLEARPYMRARLGLARTLDNLGRAVEAVTHYRELLRLDPADHQGVRYLLIVTLLDLHLDAEAGVLLDEHESDIQALWRFARVLLRFRGEGDTAVSRAALADAAAVNPHAIDYLLDVDAVPFDRPPHFALGSKAEAAYVAEVLGDHYEATPGLLTWLRSQALRLRSRRAKPRRSRSTTNYSRR